MGVNGRAAGKLSYQIEELTEPCKLFIVVGKGGNGGDGLAIARMLSKRGYIVKVLTLFEHDECCNEYNINIQMLPEEVTSN